MQIPRQGVLEFDFVEVTKPLTPESIVQIAGEKVAVGREAISFMCSAPMSRAPVGDLMKLLDKLEVMNDEAAMLRVIRECACVCCCVLMCVVECVSICVCLCA